MPTTELFSVYLCAVTVLSSSFWVLIKSMEAKRIPVWLVAFGWVVWSFAFQLALYRGVAWTMRSP